MKTFTVVKRRCSSGSLPRRMTVASPADSLWHTGRTAVRQILRGPSLQAKLTIGAPDDVYEQEADRVAAEVMRMPEPQLQKASPCDAVACPQVEEDTIQLKQLADQITPLVQRQVEDKEEKELIQAKALCSTTTFLYNANPRRRNCCKPRKLLVTSRR